MMHIKTECILQVKQRKMTQWNSAKWSKEKITQLHNEPPTLTHILRNASYATPKRQTIKLKNESLEILLADSKTQSISFYDRNFKFCFSILKIYILCVHDKKRNSENWQTFALAAFQTGRFVWPICALSNAIAVVVNGDALREERRIFVGTLKLQFLITVLP